MRYWNFDVVQLIADYPKNKSTLESIQETKEVALKCLKNPIGQTDRGDWEQYIKILELREAEYQMYVDMVYIGLRDLPEIERLVVKYWLIDQLDDEQIVALCRIDSLSELVKIKKIAITKFVNIVMPN